MLQRGINRTALTLMIINSIIGAGIFGLPSKLYNLAGVYSLLAFLACAVVIVVYILCFAEVSTQFKETGGPYLYIHKAFGAVPAFLIGWLLLLSRIFNYAVLINLLVTYLGFFSPRLTDTWPRIFIMLLLTGIISFINYRGIKAATKTSNIVTIGKLLPLLVFIIVGLFFIKPSLLQTSSLPSLSSFSEAVLLLIFAFGGFESVLINTGEIKEPQKNLPVALFRGLLTVTVFYCLIQLVCIGNLQGLGKSQRPVADAATSFMGNGGSVMIIIGAVISICGTLNVLLLSGSRLPFAFSEEKQFPSVFSQLHPRFATPIWSLVLVSVLCAGVSIAWSFLTAISVAVIIRILIYLMVCATLIKLRSSLTAKEYFRVKYGKIVAGAGILISCWLLSNCKMKEVQEVGYCIALGLLIFLINRLTVTK